MPYTFNPFAGKLDYYKDTDLTGYLKGAIEKTWQQLKDMKDASTLTPEQFYKITDFRTYHKIYNGVNWISSTDYNTGTTDPIIVQAQSSNSLFPFAYSTTYPQDSLLYELVDSSEMGGDRGRIYWRKDNTKLIEAAYDWRNVKWRRWEDAVGSGVYTMTTDPGGGEAYRDRYTWQNSQDPSSTKLATIVGDISQSFNNIWQGYAENFYLGNASYDNTFIGNCTNTTMKGRAQSNIFRARVRQSTFGMLCTGNDMNEIENCQIGDNFQNNTFSSNNFTDNIIGNNFNTNSCVAGSEAFVYNTIGGYTTDNTFDLSDDTFTLNVIDGFCIGNTMASGSSNIIGGNFLYNNFSYSFNFNNIGASCTSNTMGVGFTGNTIGYGCSSNTFQDSTYYNEISATFQSNTFSGLCQYNEFGTNFLTNSFDTDVIGCIFPVDFQNQTIANALSYYVIYNSSHKIGVDVIEPAVKLEINDADSDGEEDTGIVTIHADKDGVATANDADLLKLDFDPTDNAGGNGNLLSGWRYGSKVVNVASDGTVLTVGDVKIQSDSTVAYFGAGDDMSIGYNGTQGDIKTDLVAASDLHLDCGTDKTLVLDETVYDDLYIPTAAGRIPASNAPTFSTFTTNTKLFTFAIGDYLDLPSVEVKHDYKEGTDLDIHIHIITNGQEAVATKAQYVVYYSLGDMNEAMSGEGSLTAELTIPANTPDKTHLYLDMGNITGTNYKIGAQLITRVKRIDNSDHPGHTTYAEPAANPFVSQVGVHYQIDTLGSRQEGTK